MKNQSKGAAIGVGIAALAAAAAGAYYLYGSKEGKAHRRTVTSWMLRAKAEVMDEIEKMKEVNEGAYKEVIAKVAKKYKDIKGMDKAELAALVTRLQGHWKDIRSEIGTAGSDARRTIKRTVKKTAGKASKKS